jgi:hypothetical protein
VPACLTKETANGPQRIAAAAAKFNWLHHLFCVGLGTDFGAAAWPFVAVP